ncbi:MAG: PD40 domain-containing protein [Solirubrobacterales bacterium]|nr:PD40 domain-containing protein [Solirubrobacterales bacterium]OJU93858.1 MAG: hypothetical protein BGO23_14740 [Solirubrobacterales bacterium 67-14]
MLFGGALAAAVFSLAAFGRDSRALTPPPADKAEITYTNGGRLVQVNADGSDRKVLTRHGKVKTPGGFGLGGDRFPRVSPDGTKVLFIRDTARLSSDDIFLPDGRNMVLNRATGKVREVLAGSKRVSYENLAWLPGTDRVVASKIGKTGKASVVSVRLDGTGERVILRFRSRKSGYPGLVDTARAVRLAASPDGRSLLMTRMDSSSEYGYALELVDVATGSRKLIAKGAHSGVFSPDGSRFVFVKDRGKLMVCDFDVDCVPSGDLFTANVDGSGVSRLTDTKRDEASPSWAPDGDRIAFSGTFLRPGDRSTAELFSIGADGTCPVRLTNGSPASLDPEFVPASGEIVAPGTCRSIDRPALAETGLNPVEKKGFGKRLWLGPESSQGLLSADADLVFLSFSVYGDCGAVKASDCEPGATISTSPVCFDMGSWAKILQGLVNSRREKARGVWFTANRKRGSLETTIYSGRRTTTISGAVDAGRGKSSELRVDQQRALLDELRVEGEKWRPRLSRLKIPVIDYRLARVVKKLVRLTSIAEVMRANKVSRRWVIDELNFHANLKRLGGDFGRARCPDTSDPWGID